jgi:hypothetical protein
MVNLNLFTKPYFDYQYNTGDHVDECFVYIDNQEDFTRCLYPQSGKNVKDNFSRFTTDSRNTPSSDRDTVCTQKSPRRRSSPDNLDSREEARQQSKGKRKGRQNDPIPNRRNDLPGNFCPDQLQNAIGSKRPRTKVSRQEFVEPSGAPHSPCHEQIAQYPADLVF